MARSDMGLGSGVSQALRLFDERLLTRGSDPSRDREGALFRRPENLSLRGLGVSRLAGGRTGGSVTRRLRAAGARIGMGRPLGDHGRYGVLENELFLIVGFEHQ